MIMDIIEAATLQVTEAWRTVTNPLINDRVTFLRTARETGGEYVLVRVTLAPGGGNGLHLHRTFAEEFLAIEGVLTVECGGQRRQLAPGERASAPIGAHHRFANDTDAPITFGVLISPAQRFEETVRVAYGLARDGKTTASGLPKHPLQLALLFELGDTYPVEIPLWLQRAIFGPLARLAHWRKVERTFDAYRAPCAEVLPSFIRLERDLDFGDAPYQGDAGPLPITRTPVAEWGAV